MQLRADSFSTAYAWHEDFVQLEEANKLADITLSELTAGIAHEMQNSLNFVTNFSEVSTDLGLSLRYDIITKGYGGTLTVERRDGQGAEFDLTLPHA
ncbi:hypothetical protein [Spirosoma foliorum]|uniref:Signal transduction histidine kinase dimerisation/phosphoacceptor domain-containing protein n=1 Tax=Spirosoma foliorum TaxID=2710596 RepID=A0A7G5H6L2_9BACT|nr:hypothetical protein [Spirosoma foliorum]QMW06754.1 hypothetical protein H3H32_18605 [Spirosoma foliorum]